MSVDHFHRLPNRLYSVILQNKNKLKLSHPSRFFPGNSLLILVGVLTVSLMLAIYFGISIGQGNYFETYIVLLLLLTPAVLFIIKANYWIFIPFVIRCGLPAIPLFAGRSIALKEIWIMLSVLMLVGQLLLYRTRRPRVMRLELLPVYILLALAAVSFFREGVGLGVLGSSDQGGRKYIGIFLAVSAIIVIVHQKISEKQCKWLVVLIVGSVGVAMVITLVKWFFFRQVDIYDQEFTITYYTYHQILSPFPLMVIIWIFSKYSPVDIIVRLNVKMLSLLVFCYMVIAYSGKRMHLLLAMVIPVIASFLRRQFAPVFLYGGMGAVVLAVLVMGQGSLFNLPLSAQRAMSYIPGVKWEKVVVDRTSTNFRATLNEIAVDKIKLHPLMGNGISVSEAEIMELEMMERYAVEETDSYAYTMAAGSAWHNTWLGISTDFGIPAAIIFAFFWLQIFRYGFRLRRALPQGSHARLLVTMLLILNIGDLLQSWVSGHSLEDVLWARGWQFALLLVIKFQLEEDSSILEEVSLNCTEETHKA